MLNLSTKIKKITAKMRRKVELLKRKAKTNKWGDETEVLNETKSCILEKPIK